MSRRLWSRRLLAGSVAVVGVVSTASLALLVWTNGRPAGQTGGGKPRSAYLPPGSYVDAPLDVGTTVPAFEAEGWVNGPPPAGNPRLVVVDVWSGW